MPKPKSIIFVGQAYYNAWLLSRELRNYGWNTALVNIDSNKANEKYYYGKDEDLYEPQGKSLFRHQVELLVNACSYYDVFHFSNSQGLYFFELSQLGSNKENRLGALFLKWLKYIFVARCKMRPYQFLDLLIIFKIFKYKQGYELTPIGEKVLFYIYKKVAFVLPEHWDIELIRLFGKKITYATNGCQDGVLRSTFSKWGPYDVCSICAWRDNKAVCSDEKNAKWGEFRNKYADAQITIGGNRADYNLTEKQFEVPEFYCLDEHHWNPIGLIPANYLLPFKKETVKLFHSIGNYDARTDKDGVNIRCTHIYIKLVEELKNEGFDVELVFIKDVPNKNVKYYLQQSDIVVDVLTFGFFGANVREAMMMGVPAVCFLRPEWLEQMKEEIPDYVRELPVVSATPETVKEILIDLIQNKAKRIEIGRKSREFALKYHSIKAGGKRLNDFYTEVLNGL